MFHALCKVNPVHPNVRKGTKQSWQKYFFPPFTSQKIPDSQKLRAKQANRSGKKSLFSRQPIILLKRILPYRVCLAFFPLSFLLYPPARHSIPQRSPPATDHRRDLLSESGEHAGRERERQTSSVPLRGCAQGSEAILETAARCSLFVTVSDGLFSSPCLLFGSH